MSHAPYFDLPWGPGVAGTVFDSTDETFGPIMAAIQRGDFEVAAALLTRIGDGQAPNVAALKEIIASTDELQGEVFYQGFKAGLERAIRVLESKG